MLILDKRGRAVPRADIRLFALNPDDAASEVDRDPSRMTLRKGLIFLVLNSVAFIQAFDATCICVALPTIAQRLRASVSETLSFGTAFLLAMTVSQPVFTELAFVWGKKVSYLVALFVFMAGTLACAMAKDSTILLIGRCIQGIGAGGPQPISAMILTDMFPGRARAQHVSYMNVSWAIGTILGPILGGVFTEGEVIDWRWIFWVNMPFLTFASLSTWFLLAYDGPKEGKLRRLEFVDWTGLSVFFASSGLLLLALIWGGEEYPWRSMQVLVPMGLAIVGFLGFLFYEVKGARKPVYPLVVFKHSSTNLQLICTMIHGILMWMVLYYMSLFYLSVKALSPVMTGVWALPATLTVAPMAVAVGLFLRKTGKYRWFLYLGWSVTIAVLGIMTMIDTETPDYQLLLMTGALGVGFGVLVPAMSGNIQATVPPRAVGHAIATCYVVRAAGQCFGVAIGQSVFSYRLEVELEHLGEDPTTAQAMMRSIQSHLNVDPLTNADGLAAIVWSLQTLWIAASVMAAAAGVLTLFIRCPRLENVPDDLEEDYLGETSSIIGLRPLDYRPATAVGMAQSRSVIP